MISFFRHIRQSLITGGKTSRYLRYALGEIMLVVIGILIALQINNWNENRKLEVLLTNIYKVVQSDLEQDIQSIDTLLAIMEPKEPAFLKVINETMTREAYEQCESCAFIITGYPDLAFQTRGQNLLSDYAFLETISKHQLITEINLFYAEFNTEIDIDIEDLEEAFMRNQNAWIKDNMWYSDLIIHKKTDHFIDYALSSNDYKNRVANFYHIFYNIHIPRLKDYKEKAFKIIEHIESYKN